MTDALAATEAAQGWSSRYVAAPDGLRLHVRVFGARQADALPIVCLPGLARTGADFEPLAEVLAHDPARPRQVFAIDSRGRGRSQHDRNPANYNLQVERDDVLAVLTALEIARAVFVGTSRGGLLTMLLAVARPALVVGAVLNDIGPVIEPKGLMRIKGYVGKLPQPRDFNEGAEILRRLFDNQFPKQTAEEWLAAARRTWEARDGRLALTYDPHLARTLDIVRPEHPLPALWREFEALSAVPLMLVRGGNSDLLSPATVEAMRERHPGLEVLEIPDQGHAPHLSETATIARIARFVAGCEAG